MPVPSSSTIQQEVKQTQPFESRRQEVLVAVLRTAWMLRRRLEALVKDHGLTGQQYNVLRILRGAGEPLPTMEVACRMIEPEPGITRLVKRLAKEDLLERKECPKDGRVQECGVTKKGLDLLATLDEPILDLDNALLNDLNDEELDTLIALLDRVRAPLMKDEDTA